MYLHRSFEEPVIHFNQLSGRRGQHLGSTAKLFWKQPLVWEGGESSHRGDATGQSTRTSCAACVDRALGPLTHGRLESVLDLGKNLQ